jgi:hypothetical protein
MALDPTRAALVLQEYRYSTNEDASIKAKYTNARELVIATNLDQAGGAALAVSVFNATKNRALAFEVTVEGVLFLEDFVGGAPRYTVSFTRYPEAGSNIYMVTSASIDYFNGRTTLTVRG